MLSTIGPVQNTLLKLYDVERRGLVLNRGKIENKERKWFRLPKGNVFWNGRQDASI